MNDINPYLEIVRLVAAGIVGGSAGALVAHRLTISRERASGKASRKREFLAFMRSWRVEIGRTYIQAGGNAHDVSSFSDMVSTFAAECQSIRGDLSNKKLRKFDPLVSKVIACTGGELNQKGGCQKIQTMFDEIIALVDDT